MLSPIQTVIRRTTERTDVFRGYNHGLQIADGEFFEMENLTSDAFPVLRERPRRGVVRVISDAQGMAARESLVTVRGGVIYLGEQSMQAYMGGAALSEGEKQIV